MEEISLSQDTVSTFRNVEDIVTVTNSNLNDSMYIGKDVFLPEKKDIGRCYWTDFSLKTKEEVQKLSNEKPILLSPRYKNVDFFVYNERTNEMVPFQKNDILIYENGGGYLRFDGASYTMYDDNGVVVNSISYIDEKEPDVDDLPEIKNRRTGQASSKNKKR